MHLTLLSCLFLVIFCSSSVIHLICCFRGSAGSAHTKPLLISSLALFYLPSYAPEYNPDEYLNSDLKSNVASKPQARTVEDIQKSAEEFMTFLSETPDHVASYFEHDKLAYQRDTTDSINGNT